MAGFLSCTFLREEAQQPPHRGQTGEPSVQAAPTESPRRRRSGWKRRLAAASWGLLAITLAWPIAAREAPELRFEAPPVLAPQVEQLKTIDPASLVAIMDLLGLDQAGAPITVQLAREGSPAARLPPSWAVAYALGDASLVVLIPSRVPGYPDHTLETVLRHEIAHVLIARAARHRQGPSTQNRGGVPRWFNEGLAIHGARDWGLEDRARLTLATVRRGGIALDDLDQRFQGGQHSAASAYALSAAFVRYLLDQHGPFVASRIFDQLARGQTFDQAFRRAVGHSLLVEERRFWRHLDIWSKWVPLLSSSTTLWMLITLLALWAFKRRRERDAEQLAAWDQEELRRLEQTVLEGYSRDSSSNEWVH